MSEVTVDAAISLLLALINNASKISALIEEAKDTGQTHLTDGQWESIKAADAAARQRLVDLMETRS